MKLFPRFSYISPSLVPFPPGLTSPPFLRVFPLSRFQFSSAPLAPFSHVPSFRIFLYGKVSASHRFRGPCLLFSPFPSPQARAILVARDHRVIQRLLHRQTLRLRMAEASPFPPDHVRAFWVLTYPGPCSPHQRGEADAVHSARDERPFSAFAFCLYLLLL